MIRQANAHVSLEEMISVTNFYKDKLVSLKSSMIQLSERDALRLWLLILFQIFLQRFIVDKKNDKELPILPNILIFSLMLLIAYPPTAIAYYEDYNNIYSYWYRNFTDLKRQNTRYLSFNKRKIYAEL